jgi:hypothetical protein
MKWARLTSPISLQTGGQIRPPFLQVLQGFQWVAGDDRLVFRKEASHARYRAVPSSVGD